MTDCIRICKMLKMSERHNVFNHHQRGVAERRVTFSKQVRCVGNEIEWP
jgi:hypothetical protein